MSRVSEIMRKVGRGSEIPTSDPKLRERIEEHRTKRSTAEDYSYVPEESSAITKRHLRSSSLNKKRAESLGEGVDRLPIVTLKKRESRARSFEAPLAKLIERYGLSGWQDHASIGQLTKYVVIQGVGKTKIMNVRTSRVEWEETWSG